MSYSEPDSKSCSEGGVVRGEPGSAGPGARTASPGEEAPAPQLPARGWTRLEFHGQVNSVGPSGVHPGLARIEATVPPAAAAPAPGTQQSPPARPECCCGPLVRWLLDAQARGLVTVWNDEWQEEDGS